MKWLGMLTGGLVVVAITTLAALPVFAEIGLKVDGAIAEINAEPGKQYVHRMIVRSDENYPTMNITVTAYELGQELDGSYKALPPDKAKSAFSAYEFINNIDNKSFLLKPGSAQRVEATISVPATVKKSGGRYAVLHIRPQVETAKDKLAVIIPNIYVPVVLDFGSWDLKGEITDMTVPKIESGRPIQCLVTLTNTGNFHYRAKNQITITDISGKELLKSESLLTRASIIPSYAYCFNMNLDVAELPLGTYSVESQVLLENGTVLDTHSTSFEIKRNYVRYKSEQDEAPFTMNWSFVGGTVAFVTIIAVLILMLSRRRRAY